MESVAAHRHAKFGVDATFVKSGKYRLRDGKWNLVDSDTALPSRLTITLHGPIHNRALRGARQQYATARLAMFVYSLGVFLIGVLYLRLQGQLRLRSSPSCFWSL
jgi:hypothetical protein